MVEELKRAFVGVGVSPEIRLALGAWLRELGLPGKIVPSENLHLTLRFLGDIDQVTLERFLGGMDEKPLGPAFRIRLDKLGAFPNPRKATVGWIGIAAGLDRLEELAEVCEEAARGAGISPEERPFKPHLTVSRIRPPRDLRPQLAESASADLSWICDRVVVYQSHLGGGPPRYEPLATLTLNG